MAAASVMDFLWKEFFRDPYEYWDSRKSKKIPGSYDLGNDPSWMNDSCNPPWVYVELSRRGLRGSESLSTNEEKELQNNGPLSASIHSYNEQKSRGESTGVREELPRNDVYADAALLKTNDKCDNLSSVEGFFDQMSTQSVVTWNALIGQYIQHGLWDAALTCYKKMQDEDISPNMTTYINVLKACGNRGSLGKGEEVHAEIIMQGLLEKDIRVGNALLDMYVKCSQLAKAKCIFDKLPHKTVISWRILISGYLRNGLGNEALICYERMRDEGFCPDAATFGLLLKAICGIRSAAKGQEIHDEINKQGLLETNGILCTALVDMYVKCGAFAKAQEVLDELPVQNVISWTALIAGYVRNGLYNNAIDCYRKMQGKGISPNAVTFSCVLKACGSVGAADKGEEIHSDIMRQEYLGDDVVLGTALVDMYAKCGVLSKAQKVFDKLPVRDAVCWTALITGYVQKGLADQALDCFEQMKGEGFLPDAITLSSILKACGSIGALKKGEEIHADIIRQGLSKQDVTLGNALVDMYAKCGVIYKAQESFNDLPIKDLVSWNALMTGYVQLGQVKRVIFLCHNMLAEGITPDLVTFTILLTACTNAGLVEEAEMFFGAMASIYHLIPTLEHYLCLVDLFSSVGHFHKAVVVLDNVPSSERLPFWLALLRACQKWHHVKLGRWVFENLMASDLNDSSAYVCMSNIYAALSP